MKRGNQDADWDLHRGKMMYNNREKTAIFKSRTEAWSGSSEGTNTADTLISDFSSPGLWNTILLFKPPSLGHSVMVTLANESDGMKILPVYLSPLRDRKHLEGKDWLCFQSSWYPYWSTWPHAKTVRYYFKFQHLQTMELNKSQISPTIPFLYVFFLTDNFFLCNLNLTSKTYSSSNLSSVILNWSSILAIKIKIWVPKFIRYYTQLIKYKLYLIFRGLYSKVDIDTDTHIGKTNRWVKTISLLHEQ